MGKLFSKNRKKSMVSQNSTDENDRPTTPTSNSVPHSPSKSTLATTNPIVVAMYSFTARGPTEISFDKGDKIQILSYNGEDWWRGRNTTTGEEGYVPVPYVASLASLESQDWYFGKISRQEAETLLLTNVNITGSFLVRASDKDSQNHLYSISVRVDNHGYPVKHFRVLSNADGYFFISMEEIFMTINDLVDAYLNSDHSEFGLYRHIKIPCKREAPVINNLTPDNQWEVSLEDLQFEKRIGQGSFGEVWLGTWSHKVTVAIKYLVGESMTRDQFLEEAAIMKTLRHKNILTLYGVCSTTPPLLIITEYMTNGSLINYIRNEPELPMNYKIYITTQVASGMMYLENKRLIHRDLAARNVLVGDSLVCKIADFGLARLMHGDEYDIHNEVKLPIKWTAPEAYEKNLFTIKSDVWSFGILCYEIFTNGGIPYPGIDKREVMHMVGNGYKMSKPASCPDFIYELMVLCWNIDMDLRPSFDYITDFLSNINIYSEGGYDEEENFRH